MINSADINKKILIAGDSHCIILGNILVGTDPDRVSRIPQVEFLHLGPALAFTLPMTSSLNAGIKLAEHIESNRDLYDALMLCFGEIDIRVHVVKQAVLQNISLELAVTHLVNNYFTYIDSLIVSFDLPVFLWGPIGTMPDDGFLYNSEYPTVAREQERNWATILFNRILAARCAEHSGAHLISIADHLIDVDLRTKSEFYHDGVHLNRKGLSLGLIEIRNRLTEFGFEQLATRFPEQIYCVDRPMLCNISNDSRIVYLSSTQEKDKAKETSTITNVSGLPFIFHTELEDRPRIVIDLGCVQMVRCIEIYNRRDGLQERANSINVGISNDRYLFNNVYKSIGRQTFGLDGKPLFLSFNTVCHFRYLQLELEDRNYFHLAEIKVWAMSFLNPL